MSMAYNELVARLAFGLPDRLNKALDVSGVSSTEMAEYLGVSRNTISNYINGRTVPKTQTLRLWAMRTGAPLEWLQTGELNEKAPHPDGPGEGQESRLWESNPRPIHYKGRVRRLFPTSAQEERDLAA